MQLRASAELTVLRGLGEHSGIRNATPSEPRSVLGTLRTEAAAMATPAAAARMPAAPGNSGRAWEAREIQVGSRRRSLCPLCANPG